MQLRAARSRLCNLAAESRLRIPGADGFTEVPFCLTAQVSTAVYDKRTEITVYVFSDG